MFETDHIIRVYGGLHKRKEKDDSGGVRTHALSDWRLKPAPWTTRPHYLLDTILKAPLLLFVDAAIGMSS